MSVCVHEEEKDGGHNMLCPCAGISLCYSKQFAHLSLPISDGITALLVIHVDILLHARWARGRDCSQYSDVEGSATHEMTRFGSS